MLFYYITVKTPLKRKRLSLYCGKFFKLNFNSKYVCVQAKVRDMAGKTYNIGENYNINVSEAKSLSSYRIKIIEDYEKYLLLGNKSKIVRFIFEYKPINLFEIMKGNNEKNH